MFGEKSQRRIPCPWAEPHTAGAEEHPAAVQPLGDPAAQLQKRRLPNPWGGGGEISFGAIGPIFLFKNNIRNIRKLEYTF